MNAAIKLANWLDRHEFLGTRLWEFSLRNVVRPFPWYFWLRVLLPHPLTALRGFFAYHRLVRDAEGRALYGSADFAEIRRLFFQGKYNPRRFMIAAGFCMKPYDIVGHKSNCPVGRFNHNCFVLENSAMLSQDRQYWPKPCQGCNIGILAQLGAKLQADFYIMTSALDIARDLFLPATKGDGTHLGIFLLCLYSSEAFTLALATSGIKGSLFTFCSGDCLNHEDFTKADKGFKDKQTFIEESQFESLKQELSAMADASSTGKVKNYKYVKRGNVYHAV